MNKIKIIVLLLILILLAGCSGKDFVSTDINSVVDPNYRNINYSRIVAFCNINDMAARKELETAIKKEGQKENITIYKSIEEAPPTREYSEEELMQVFRNLQARAILLVDIIAEDIKRDTYTTDKQTTIKRIGNYYYAEEQGGDTYELDKPIARIEAILIDLETGVNIWKGQVKAKGAAISNFRHVREKTAEEIIKNLREKNLI
ncbi:MAG: hypothetical protein ACOCZR_03380 [Halanaerobiales bacterium]